MKPYLQLSLPETVVKKALQEITPLRIHLSPPEDDSRWIELDPPQEVEFQPGLVIRVVTTGKFKFELAGVKVPAHLDRVEFRLMPRIAQSDDNSHRVAMPIEILDGDLRFIPDLLDDFIVSQVNRALSPEDSQLVWRFDETLSALFNITERLQPLKSMGLVVDGSEIVVTEHELIMRVYYELDFVKHAEGEPQPKPAAESAQPK